MHRTILSNISKQFKMKLFSTFLFSLFFFQIHAQGWDKTLTDSLRIASAEPTSDGGCVLFGWKTNLTTTAIVLKVDANGKSQWSRPVSNLSFVDEPYVTGRIRILQDKQNNYWISYSSYSSALSSIVKLDNSGNILWSRTIPMTNVEAHVGDNQMVFWGRGTGSDFVGYGLLRLSFAGDTLGRNLIPTSDKVYRSKPVFCNIVEL